MKTSLVASKMYQLAKQFVSGDTMTATDFVDKYTDLYYDKSIKGKTTEINPKDYVKDEALLSSIFLHCDTHESMNSMNPYTDEELKIAVAIFLDADDVNTAYAIIREKGLLK